ncbi:MAG: DUF896 domain-containing protein [Ruminococcus sp.]|nr:DUF896 domain-containing protein [Ruminococcus sp.]MBQ7070280.1 DUF896 domain-containing protein [Ruminococcus sp.]
MEKEKLNRLSLEELTGRINRFSALSRERELSPEEVSEREGLRMEYRRRFRANLTAQLEHTTIVEPDGSRIKVSDMKRSGEDNTK